MEVTVGYYRRLLLIKYTCMEGNIGYYTRCYRLKMNGSKEAVTVHVFTLYPQIVGSLTVKPRRQQS